MRLHKHYSSIAPPNIYLGAEDYHKNEASYLPKHVYNSLG